MGSDPLTEYVRSSVEFVGHLDPFAPIKYSSEDESVSFCTLLCLRISRHALYRLRIGGGRAAKYAESSRQIVSSRRGPVEIRTAGAPLLSSRKRM